ncbi:MAG: 1,2-phenylacetyl-CoA epoxidase subunit PaaD, partial [Jatrophihabitans sp.]|uniref:1,2-phenylacetyl-CoA epoxidase subunit PaaD n=1 Tax=Jatrophihabitans sp. TaxID=1932789 RepID=UPI003F80BA5C
MAATPDPELPHVTIAELGILREVAEAEGEVVVTITPTYSGCPAMREIGADITARLHRAGHDRVRVRTALSPAWTTEWITETGRRKLAAAGIAPPTPVHRRGPGGGGGHPRARAAPRRGARAPPARGGGGPPPGPT